ncbi:hypothetical protein PV328_012319, partial [Microctonus aethiopoides]
TILMIRSPPKTRSMSNEEGSDKRASSLEESSVANLNETISISKDNGESKGATRKKTTKNSNMDKIKSKPKIIENKKVNLLDEMKETDDEIDLFSNQNEARDRNRINIENEKLMIENNIENIVENSRVESLIGGPRREKNMLGATHVESVLFTPASELCRQLHPNSLTKGRSRRAMEIPPEDERFPCQTNEGNNLSRKKNLLFDENNSCNSNEYFNDFNILNGNVGSNEYGLGQFSNPDAYQNLTTIVRVTFELPNGQVISKVKSASLQECQKYFNWPDEVRRVKFSDLRQSDIQTVARQDNSCHYPTQNSNRFDRNRLSREDASAECEDEFFSQNRQLENNIFSQPTQRRRNYA